jgi:hypothetical protein
MVACAGVIEIYKHGETTGQFARALRHGARAKAHQRCQAASGESRPVGNYG